MIVCGYDGCKKEPALDRHGSIGRRCAEHKGRHAAKPKAKAKAKAKPKKRKSPYSSQNRSRKKAKRK